MKINSSTIISVGIALLTVIGVIILLVHACTPLYGAEPEATPTPIPEVNAETPRINVNTASLDELVELPGIGKVIAQRIIDGRTYATVDELLNVKGIAYSKLEKIRPYITVGGDSESEPTPTPESEEPAKE